MPTVYAGGANVRPVVSFSSLEEDIVAGSGEGTSASPFTPPSQLAAQMSIDDPAGNTTTFSNLHRLGGAKKITDPLDQNTVLALDADGRVTSVTPAGGATTSYTYDPGGSSRLNSVTDNALGRTVTYVYVDTLYALPDTIKGDIPTRYMNWDSSGRLVSTWVGSSATSTTFTYGIDGRLNTQTDPRSHVTTYYYAATGFANLDSVKVENRTTRYAYDAYGRRTSVTAPNGDAATTAYDLINRVESVTDPNSGVTDYTYDDLYLTQVKDALGQTYDFTVNALGWVTDRRDPRLKSDVYEYDVLGRVTKWTDRRALVTTYTYDVLGSLELAIADGDTTRYNIDTDGDFYVVDNGVSRDSLVLDNAGRVTTHFTFRGNDTIQLASTYDSLGNRNKLTMSKPWSRTISYTQDAFGQLATLTDLNGDATTLSYNADRQATSFDLPIAATKDLQFPSTHRAGEVTWQQTILNDAYGFKLAQDNMRRIGERHWAGADTTRFYYYDNLGRLTRYEDWQFDSTGCTWDGDTGNVCIDGNKVFSDSVHYAYDKVGNRTDHAATVATGNRLTAYNGYTLSWDDAGYLTQKKKTGVITQDFYWNARGQLDSVSTDGVKTRFTYDGLGRRIKKDADGTVTQYIHDGDDVLMELDGSFNILAEYTMYPGTDRLHSMIRDSATYYYATDEKGTVLGLMDDIGLVKNKYRYDPWGEPEGTATEAVTNPFRYIGRVWDDETDLLLLRARYYDPQVGRFISEDPIGLAGGINGFAYAGGDPVNNADPTGLYVCSITGLISGDKERDDEAIEKARRECWRRWLAGQEGQMFVLDAGDGNRGRALPPGYFSSLGFYPNGEVPQGALPRDICVTSAIDAAGSAVLDVATVITGTKLAFAAGRAGFHVARTFVRAEVGDVLGSVAYWYSGARGSGRALARRTGSETLRAAAAGTAHTTAVGYAAGALSVRALLQGLVPFAGTRRAVRRFNRLGCSL